MLYFSCSLFCILYIADPIRPRLHTARITGTLVWNRLMIIEPD